MTNLYWATGFQRRAVITWGFVSVLVLATACTPKPSSSPTAAVTSVPVIDTTKPLPSQVSPADCAEGLKPLPSNFEVICGVHLEMPGGRAFASSSYDEKGKGTLSVQIGQTLYTGVLEGETLTGANFKLSYKKGKTVQDCKAAEREAEPCENVISEAEIRLECPGKTHVHRDWRVNEGC